jgi:hypothetical protein
MAGDLYLQESNSDDGRGVIRLERPIRSSADRNRRADMRFACESPFSQGLGYEAAAVVDIIFCFPSAAT